MASSAPTILIAGASRGLGHAMAAEFVTRGWQVIGTVRDPAARTKLHDLHGAYPAVVEIETLDIDLPDQITALRDRLAGRSLDMLFVNAGITPPDPNILIGEVTTDIFSRVMITNALSPMRVIGALQDIVPETGLIGVMSSGQGSITNNMNGLRDVYRGSKAALNMFMKGFAARRPANQPLVLMAPGWVKTDLGGDDAPLSIEDSVPKLVNVLLAMRAQPGLHYVDYLGRIVPW